ncbi:MAG: AMP-binding protein [Chromatiales bacterium]|nr:AMP-binding protein [Chromatiales bacterium]
MDTLDQLTLEALLERSIECYPDNPCLSWVEGEPLTYAQLGEQVGALSALLSEQGIDRGDRVGLLSENMPNWGVAYFAIVSMGAVVVPILPEFHASAVHHILRHAECKALFVSEKLYTKVEEFTTEMLSTRLLLNDFSLIPPDTPKHLLSRTLEAGRKEFEKLKEAAERKLKQTDNSAVSPDDLACIIYTSGTTGNSKGVMLTHGNLMFDAEAAAEVMPIHEADRFLSILPLSHTYECTLGFILALRWGASIYYLEKPPTAKVLVPAMSKIKPTIMLSVPLVIEKIYKMRIQPKFSANGLIRTLYAIGPIRRKLNQIAGKKLLETFGGELRFFGIGGAAVSHETEKFLKEAGFPYAIGYGLTETAPLVAGSLPMQTKLRAVGPAFPGIEIRVADPNPGTGEGEIQVKGGNVMRGYFKAPEITEEVFTEDGWFCTGDLGFVDHDGFLHIRGRSKNMILGPSGENIYPEEIESVLNEQDMVLESLVFQDGGKLAARVYLDYDKLDETLIKNLPEEESRQKVDELLTGTMKAVNSKLSSFSRLGKIIEQTEPFEKTPTMKIKRFLYVSN